MDYQAPPSCLLSDETDVTIKKVQGQLIIGTNAHSHLPQSRILHFLVGSRRSSLLYHESGKHKTKLLMKETLYE